MKTGGGNMGTASNLDNISLLWPIGYELNDNSKVELAENTIADIGI